MIYIKESHLPTSNVVPLQEKFIGVINSNNVENRIFVLPVTFKKLNLSDDNFSFVLQIVPVNKKETPYTQLLNTEVNDNNIYLTWNITRLHTKDPGSLSVSILIINTEKDIVWQSYKYDFVIINGINTSETIIEMPQSALEQLVMQAIEYAKNAKLEFDLAKAEVELIKTYVAEIKEEQEKFIERLKNKFPDINWDESLVELINTIPYDPNYIYHIDVEGVGLESVPDMETEDYIIEIID